MCVGAVLAAGRAPNLAVQPAGLRVPARALLVFPTTIFLLATLGLAPGLGRFMACVGLLVLGILVKIVFRLALPIELRTWANPWAALMSSCFWDTIICAVIMEHVPPLSPSTLLHAL